MANDSGYKNNNNNIGSRHVPCKAMSQGCLDSYEGDNEKREGMCWEEEEVPCAHFRN